jgi:hypothetical protein
MDAPASSGEIFWLRVPVMWRKRPCRRRPELDVRLFTSDAAAAPSGGSVPAPDCGAALQAPRNTKAPQASDLGGSISTTRSESATKTCVGRRRWVYGIFLSTKMARAVEEVWLARQQDGMVARRPAHAPANPCLIGPVSSRHGLASLGSQTPTPADLTAVQVTAAQGKEACASRASHAARAMIAYPGSCRLSVLFLSTPGRAYLTLAHDGRSAWAGSVKWARGAPGTTTWPSWHPRQSPCFGIICKCSSIA